MIDFDEDILLNEYDAKILEEKYEFTTNDANQISIAFHKLKLVTESDITIDELMQIFYNYGN